MKLEVYKPCPNYKCNGGWVTVIGPKDTSIQEKCATCGGRGSILVITDTEDPEIDNYDGLNNPFGSMDSGFNPTI